LDVQAVAEVSGKQEVGAGQQRVADGVGALEVEKFHGGSSQDQQECRPGGEAGGQRESGGRSGDQRGLVDGDQAAGPGRAEALLS
jgi:hypothetical protein